MAKKLFTGQTVKVENRSGFDKSRFNALTTKVGTITPIAKQLLIPGTSGKLSVAISAELPPVVADKFLRSHLKVEAFLVPLRLCYGGFESWFCGSPHSGYIGATTQDGRSDFRAKLPYLYIPESGYASELRIEQTDADDGGYATFNRYLGPGSLADYLGCRYFAEPYVDGSGDSLYQGQAQKLNIFPFLCYHLIYDHWYRNKNVTKPIFMRPGYKNASSSPGQMQAYASGIPYVAYSEKVAFVETNLLDASDKISGGDAFTKWYDRNGDLLDLHQRNFGDDYFTVAKTDAQEGSAMAVDTSSGQFTIASLRLQNSLQQFGELNQLASVDFQQTIAARYGASLGSAVAQKPVLLGSADFPMFSAGVDQTAEDSSASNRNPFKSVAARYGRAYASGKDFVCEFTCDEPAYLMVMATLVPEANYATGISHDMLIFTEDGDLTDLPVAMLENIGNEPILKGELSTVIYRDEMSEPFGYVPRYLWHKSGQMNEIHGEYRKGSSLQHMIPQRVFETDGPNISTSFIEVPTSALDDITVVQDWLAQFGVQMDCAIELFVSEPLSESALPSLQNPAIEHGKNVYLKNGGSPLA